MKALICIARVAGAGLVSARARVNAAPVLLSWALRLISVLLRLHFTFGEFETEFVIVRLRVLNLVDFETDHKATIKYNITNKFTILLLFRTK